MQRPGIRDSLSGCPLEHAPRRFVTEQTAQEQVAGTPRVAEGFSWLRAFDDLRDEEGDAPGQHFGGLVEGPADH